MDKKIKKVFVIDDDKDLQIVVRRILENSGYHVEVFSNIPEIKAKLKLTIPDLLITDVYLEEETCVEFLKEKQEHANYKNIPTIILTSSAHKKTIAEVLTLNISDYILKPVNATHLARSIKKVFFNVGHREVEWDDLPMAKAKSKISFTKISETLIKANTPLKILANTDYQIDSPELEQVGIVSGKMHSQRLSTFQSDQACFESEFKIRGIKESVLQKIRSGNI